MIVMLLLTDYCFEIYIIYLINNELAFIINFCITPYYYILNSCFLWLCFSTFIWLFYGFVIFKGTPPCNWERAFNWGKSGPIGSTQNFYPSIHHMLGEGGRSWGTSRFCFVCIRRSLDEGMFFVDFNQFEFVVYLYLIHFSFNFA